VKVEEETVPVGNKVAAPVVEDKFEKVAVPTTAKPAAERNPPAERATMTPEKAVTKALLKNKLPVVITVGHGVVPSWSFSLSQVTRRLGLSLLLA
jgi:hypothetical protein